MVMTIMGFNWLDWLIIFLLAGTTCYGWLKGGINSVLSLIVWISAFYVTIHFYQPMANWLHPWVKSLSIRRTGAIAGLLLFSLVVGKLSSNLLADKIKWLGIAGVDRGLGLVLGFARGAFLVAIVMLGFKITGKFEQVDVWQHSIIAGRLEYIVDWGYHQLCVV